jgi:putative PIG3 family NAD(P)H quinone oxidoreductase
MVPGKEEGALELRDVPVPEPGPGELLLRVKATALNRADLYQLKGLYQTEKTAGGTLTIAGLEAAGEVSGIGKNVSGYKIGDRIMGMCPGGYAEFTTIDQRLAMRVPERLSWEEAATIPVAYMTEYNALIMNAHLQAGETVFVNAASSGVGVAAVQIAKFFGAKMVIGTASTPAKLAALRALGMDVGINYRTENFADAVLAATGGAGTDVIIDHVGASSLKENLRCMALKGRLVNVGRLGGGTGELDLELLAYKRLQLIGVTNRTRTLDERGAIARGVVSDLLPALRDGQLKPVIDRVFPLYRASEAQAYMASNAQVGKIVLNVEGARG